jgi:hypothetical protein
MSAVTLEQYEAAERDVSLHKTLIGLRVHALVIALVWAALILVNIFMAPGFPGRSSSLLAPASAPPAAQVAARLVADSRHRADRGRVLGPDIR